MRKFILAQNKKSSRKMAGNDELRNMVMTFRVSELQMLLGFAGRNKSGRKTELQARAVELLRLKSTPIQMKIRELYKSIQQGLASGQPPGEPVPTGQSQAPNVSSNLVNNSMMQQQPHQRPPSLMGLPSNPPTYPVYSQQRDQRPIFNAQMYQSYPQKVTPSPTLGSYPVHPDVRFKSLPFYDLLSELLKPSSLMPQSNQRLQDCAFVFHLTPSQATDISVNRDIGPGPKSDYVIQVQMRFCMLETSCEQDDFFPPGVIVKINGKICPLPNPIPTNKQGVEPKRPPRPVNITNLVRISPTVTNHVSITWAAEYGRGYVMALYLVRKLTSTQLLQRLKAKGIRHADYTTGLIKEKLKEDLDSEIATTSLRVSLLCPLGKMRMTTPSRSSGCSHLQCFDASTFLQMNERKPTWMCPVCDKPCLYETLSIDGYFQDVLISNKLQTDVTEVQLHQDGTWSTFPLKKEPSRELSPVPTPTKEPTVVETISVEIEDDLPEGEVPPKEPPKQKEVVIDLTSTDSESDLDDEQPTMITEKFNPAIVKLNSESAPATNRLFSTDSNSNASAAGGRSSVTSSGYISPNIITLDSPSPPPDFGDPSPDPAPSPASANTHSTLPSSHSLLPLNTQPHSILNSTPYTLPPSMPTFFDLEADSDNSLFQTPRF